MKVVAKLRQRGEKDQPPKLLCYIKWLKNVVFRGNLKLITSLKLENGNCGIRFLINLSLHHTEICKEF